MKFLHLLGTVILFSIFLSFTSIISSCTKIKTVYDTTTVIIHDTALVIKHDTAIVIKHDTTITKDSIYDLSSGLVAYYSFNAGSLSDSSGYNNNIIFNNATKTADRFGNPNNAYLFDGSSTYMRVLNSYSLNPDNITIYAIVKVNGFYTGPCSGNQILIKGPEYQTNGIYVLAFFDSLSNCGIANLNNETFFAGYGDNLPQGAQAYTLDNTAITTGQWYHVTYTYDGLTAKLYINGVLKRTQQRMVNFTDNTNDVYIGKTENPTYPYYFNGVIDEMRIYNRALPADAIRYLVTLTN
jgi:hypothetical protein